MPGIELLNKIPNRITKEYKTANVNVITTITSRKLKFQYENFNEIIIHAPTIRNVMFNNTTSVPPKYFPNSNCDRDTGLDSSKSMFPFSSIMGTKLAEAKMANNRHRLESGAVITN
jgi:hypothetical protein